MIKEVLVTHEDLDGAGCAVVYSLAKPKEILAGTAKICYASNSAIDDVTSSIVKEYGTEIKLVFADIAPTKEKLIELLENGISVEIYDHHATNLPLADICSRAVVVPKRVDGDVIRLESGTSLLFRHYYEGHTFPTVWHGKYPMLKEFVDLVRSYDSYEWKQTGTLVPKRLQTLFNMLRMERFVRNIIWKISAITETSLFSDIENEIIDAQLEKEDENIAKITDADVFKLTLSSGYTAAVFFPPSGLNISELSYQFLQKYKQFDMLIGLNLSYDIISFRCIRDDIDTGALLAKVLGGGGHPKASGAPIQKLLKEEFARMVLAKIL